MIEVIKKIAQFLSITALYLVGFSFAGASNSTGTVLQTTASSTLSKVCQNVDCSISSRVNMRPDVTATASPIIFTDFGVTGYAWGDEIGWVNFSPTNGGVYLSATTGRLTGLAWSQVGGWINFWPGTSLSTSTDSAGVWVDSNGQLNGNAWVSGLGGGWMKFNCSLTDMCITTDWRIKIQREACQNGIDDDGDALVDMADSGCLSPTGTSEGSSPISNSSTGGGIVIETPKQESKDGNSKPPVEKIIDKIIEVAREVIGGGNDVVPDGGGGNEVAPIVTENPKTNDKSKTVNNDVTPKSIKLIKGSKPLPANTVVSTIINTKTKSGFDIKEKNGEDLGVNEPVYEVVSGDTLYFELKSQNKKPKSVEALLMDRNPFSPDFISKNLSDKKGLIGQFAIYVKNLVTGESTLSGLSGDIYEDSGADEVFADGFINDGTLYETYKVALKIPDGSGVYKIAIKTVFSNGEVSVIEKTLAVKPRGLVFFTPYDFLNGDTPVANASIYAEQKIGANFVPMSGVVTKTDSEGKYSMLLNRGDYRLIVVTDDYKKFTSGDIAVKGEYSIINNVIELTCQNGDLFGCSQDTKAALAITGLIVFRGRIFYLKNKLFGAKKTK